MTVDVKMPQMGESIAEGTLVKWHKKPGDRIERDETLFEISTDKVDTEIPSPAAGYLAKVLVKEGETVPVHTVVCVLSDSAPQEGTAAESSAPSQAARLEAPSLAPAPTPEPTPVSALAPAPTPSERHGEEGAAAARRGTLPSTSERLREKSSPLVRRLAAEHGIELSRLKGSGAAGRVTKEDLLRHLAEHGEQGAPAVAPRPAQEDRLEPMSVMRRRIAEHMIASRRASAHVSTVFEVDMSAVRALRESLAPQFQAQHGVKLTYLPFIIRAVAANLRRFPLLNASIEGESVRYHARVNIGVAVALDDGLIVPVIRDADAKGLAALAQAASDLAARARSKKLNAEEVHGGTFTITNPGVFGSLIGTPIINQPQSGILCVGAIQKRVVVLPDTDAIAIRSMVYLSLTYDHRLVDGAVADRFMAGVKSSLEEPDGAAPPGPPGQPRQEKNTARLEAQS